MSTLKTGAIRGTSGSADSIQIHATNQSVTFPGNVTCSGTATGFGLYESYAVVGERLDASTAAGTFTSGAYRIRVIDEEFYDPDGIVSLSSNQFTLQAGTYLIWWSCPGYVVDKHHAKLYNVTDSANVAAGEACKVGTSSSTQTRSSGMARVTISGAKAFEIRHICSSTKADNGLGENAHGSDISDNIITWVQIWKEI